MGSGFDAVLEDVRSHEDRLAERAKKSPKSAIRLFCITCMGGSKHDVKHCESASCPLHPFRMGKVASRREMTAEQRAAAAERLRIARESFSSDKEKK